MVLANFRELKLLELCFTREPFNSINKVIGPPSIETSDLITAESGEGSFIVYRVFISVSPIFDSPSNVQVSPSTVPLAASPRPILVVHSGLGEKDEALRSLESAVDLRAPLVILLRVDPRFDSLRQDSHFQNLLRRMNLGSG